MMLIAAFVIMEGCDGEPKTLTMPAHPADCDAEPAAELRTLCLVQVAADRAREGDVDEARAACAGVTEGVWMDECHFRTGEELARAGRMKEGLEFCAKAGRFRGFCFTHAVWNAPPDDAPLAAWEALGTPFEAEEGVASLRARWWFNHYVGTGLADSAAAIAAPPESAAAARGAWAIEAIRLCDGDIPCAHTGWGSTAPAGPPLAPNRRVGRYDLPFPFEAERALPSVPGFAGSRRLVGETADEDLMIALLEGVWFHEKSGASAFAAWLDDPRPRVRYTALRCFRSLPSPDAEAVLTAMRGDLDPIVAAHIDDALKFETWKGKGTK